MRIVAASIAGTRLSLAPEVRPVTYVSGLDTSSHGRSRSRTTFSKRSSIAHRIWERAASACIPDGAMRARGVHAHGLLMKIHVAGFESDSARGTFTMPSALVPRYFPLGMSAIRSTLLGRP